MIGFLSGLFGVGGGFLMTPTLILMGIPPAVAVGTQSAQILASSVSGVLANSAAGRSTSRWATCWWRWVMGSGAGVGLFNLLLMRLGQIDIFVSLAYVLFLGTVGAIMFAEPGHDPPQPPPGGAPRPPAPALLVHGWPLKTRFPTRGSTSACSCRC